MATRTLAASIAAASLLALAGAASAQLSQGPDVVYQDMQTVSVYGPVGAIRAYALGSHTCNRGNQNLLWTNDATPGFGMNLYRLQNGRLRQIGQSWVKTACCAAAGSGCGFACNGQGGSVLGSGCLDVYSSGWNAIQNNLAPRSAINPWTGQYSGIPGGSFNAVDRRLQVQTTDLQTGGAPGVLFFAEGVYVATDEHNVNNNLNKLNNASYRRVDINQSTFQMTFPAGSAMQATRPAIYAWKDHGLGVNTPDPAVVITPLDVPAEGRFYLGHKVSDNGDGTWRYEYAVFNQNSHESAGSFAIPIPAGAVITNAGFHDVNYHSGEPYDNTDWSIDISPTAVTWSSPQVFFQNPNSNALRWGTMYNFYFDADVPPGDGFAALRLFRANHINLSATVSVPIGDDCVADFDGSGAVNSNDISVFLTTWILEAFGEGYESDINNDGVVNSGDISDFLTLWLDAVQNGC